MLALLAGVYFAWPVWRATLPLEIDVNEGWNAYYADAVRTGAPLYSANELISNNYPPLSFHFVDSIAAITAFDALYVGRVLSLLATAATALGIWLCIRELGGSRLAAWAGALSFFATISRFIESYVGMNDPHLVALAIMTLALAWLLRLASTRRPVEPAIIVMAIAGFYKHNVFAIPIGAILWLALNDRRRALRSALVGAATVVLGLSICWLLYGEAFFQALLMPRQYRLITALASLGRLQWIAPAGIIALAWAWYQRRSEPARFFALFMTIAFISHFLQKLAEGVDDNAQFELMVPVAIGLGCAFENAAAFPIAKRWTIDRVRVGILLILIARLLFSLRVSPYLVLTSPEFRNSLHQDAMIARAEVARVTAIPGLVSCSNLMVCRWAGKPFVYDPFTISQHLAAGRLTRDELNGRTHQLRFVTIDPRASLSGRR